MGRILVVDDDERVRQMIKDVLERAGHRVICAADGLQATEFHKDDTFDVVITDLSMPYREGFTVIEELKTQCPTLKIIAISGVSGKDEYLLSAKSFGACRTLSKPFGAIALEKMVNELINEKP